MSEKFTKGPWKATYDSQLQAAIEIYNTEDRVMVAVLPDRGTVEAMPEIEANANLIAAAPDMYEALEEVWRILDSTMPLSRDNRADRIKRILCKARGEEGMSEPKKPTPGPWKVIDNRPKVDYPVKKGMEWVKNTIEIVGFKRYTGELTCVARIDHRIGYYPIDDEDMANADPSCRCMATT